MGTMSEIATEVRRGFVVEETLGGCRRGRDCREMRVIPSDEYGVDVFNDLTPGLGAREHTGWEDGLEGFCSECECEITYRRMFVVVEVVRTTTTIEVIA